MMKVVCGRSSALRLSTFRGLKFVETVPVKVTAFANSLRGEIVQR